MKVLLLVIAVSSLATATGQSAHRPDLTDEFPATLCSDDFRARIDNFLAAISQRPDSIGSVVITPDRSMPGRAMKYRNMITNHVNFRGFDPERVLVSETRFGESTIQFWLVPKGAKFGDRTLELNRISATTLFDASGTIKDPFTGELTFGEESSEPCDFGLRFDQFASLLKADNELSAHLLFSSGGRIDRKGANRALNVAIKQLSNDLGIADDRIRTKYVGRRKHAEMQLWLVPKESAPPVFREGAVP